MASNFFEVVCVWGGGGGGGSIMAADNFTSDHF